MARVQAEGLSYEEALRRNIFDRQRPRHPRPEVDRWYWAVIDAGLGDPAEWLYRICRESGGHPTVWNRSDPAGGSVGLLQINLGNRFFLASAGVLSSTSITRHDAAMELMDPVINLRAARALANALGRNPWSTRHRVADCAPPAGLAY